jgi:hypothetical protein
MKISSNLTCRVSKSNNKFSESRSIDTSVHIVAREYFSHLDIMGKLFVNCYPTYSNKKIYLYTTMVVLYL